MGIIVSSFLDNYEHATAYCGIKNIVHGNIITTGISLEKLSNKSTHLAHTCSIKVCPVTSNHPMMWAESTVTVEIFLLCMTGHTITDRYFYGL